VHDIAAIAATAIALRVLLHDAVAVVLRVLLYEYCCYA